MGTLADQPGGGRWARRRWASYEARQRGAAEDRAGGRRAEGVEQLRGVGDARAAGGGDELAARAQQVADLAGLGRG